MEIYYSNIKEVDDIWLFGVPMKVRNCIKYEKRETKCLPILALRVFIPHLVHISHTISIHSI